MTVGANTETDLYTRISNLEAVVFSGQKSGASPAYLGGVDSPPVQVMATAGAAVITPQGGIVIFTASGAVLATLAQPTAGLPTVVAGGQDGISLILLDVNAQANTVTTASNGINGNKHVLTDGAATANQVTLRAYNGVWYVQTNTNWTLS